MKSVTTLRILTTVALLSGLALHAEPPAAQATAPQPPALQPPPPQEPEPQSLMMGDNHQRGMSRPSRGPGGSNAKRQNPRPPQTPSPEQLKKAGATDAQIQALSDLDFSQQGKRIDLQARIEKAELTLGHLLQAASVDETAVLDATDVLTSAQGEMFKLEISSQLKVRQMLGEELLRKLREMGPPPQMSQPPRAREQGEPGHGPQNTPPEAGHMRNNGPDAHHDNNGAPRPPMDDGR